MSQELIVLNNQNNQQKQEKLPQEKRKHLSYSEMKMWAECSHKHKLVYVDKIKKFQGNEYTAFGTALHYVNEVIVVEEDKVAEAKIIFEKSFLKELTNLKSTGFELNKKLVTDMREQGKNIVEYVLPQLKEYFGNYEVVSVEEPIYQPITNFDTDLNFKGFIDLIVKTDDGKYHIIDWKTCSWGWDMKKRSDRLITYQLTLYKNFYSLKYNIDVKDIETHFALLKRTAKKQNVEIFRVTSGARKMKNALDLLEQAATTIQSGFSVKNRMSCKYCEFYKTEHCR